MSRLPNLLRYFKLPPTATPAELRQAYLHRVKRVHPDVTGGKGASHEEFVELQKNFEELQTLLSGHHPTHPNPNAGFGAYATGPQEWPAHRGRAPPRRQHATVGLPQTSVYATTFGFFTMFASAVFFLRRPSSEDDEKPKASTASQKIVLQGKGATRSPGNSWAELETGPWNVALATADVQRKSFGAPSKTPEILDCDSFFTAKSRSHGRNTVVHRKRPGEKQGRQAKHLGNDAPHQPLVREGVEMLPVHAAAADGLVWWLEQCGAASNCRGMLDLGDAREDTPLHHAARHGQVQSCKALLRLGADAGVQNALGALPEELAEGVGGEELVTLLRSVRSAQETKEDVDGLAELAGVHADGLGMLAKPPGTVVYSGLRDSDCIRRAVNMVAGCKVVPPLPVTRSEQEGPDADEHVANVIRGSLQGTEFVLEDVDTSKTCPKRVWDAALDGGEVCGFLAYEPPKSVSADAPGHWVALRRELVSVPTPTEVKHSAASCRYWRLDPVRGSFRLTADEFIVFLERYRVWRLVVAGPSS